MPLRLVGFAAVAPQLLSPPPGAVVHAAAVAVSDAVDGDLGSLVEELEDLEGKRYLVCCRRERCTHRAELSLLQ